MMKTFEVLYLSYYFLVRNDKYLSKTGRVRFLIETILFMACASILFLICGVLNLRTDLKITSILMLVALVTSYYGGEIIFGKGKELEYIQAGKNYDLKKKRVFSILGLLILLLSFVMMILSAIIMSYLWSKDLF